MTQDNSEQPQGDEQSKFPDGDALYKLLKKCRKPTDVAEWNKSLSKWRKDNPGKRIPLHGANLKECWLRGADLSGADLTGANLSGADLRAPTLEMAANPALREANMRGADLSGAILIDANLCGTKMGKTNLTKATFRDAIVDGGTKIADSCDVSRWVPPPDPRDPAQWTDFRLVALDSAGIGPGVKQLLEYNIRRDNWEDWYKKHPYLSAVVRGFWGISDYGRSTWGIIRFFFVAAMFFAVLYACRPDWIMVDVGGYHELQGFHHAVYFSIVTMTTLGFGDICANPGSHLGQDLLMLQVLLGYVLLGALITRFAVMFTSGGPSALFIEEIRGRKRRFHRRRNPRFAAHVCYHRAKFRLDWAVRTAWQWLRNWRTRNIEESLRPLCGLVLPALVVAALIALHLFSATPQQPSPAQAQAAHAACVCAASDGQPAASTGPTTSHQPGS